MKVVSVTMDDEDIERADRLAKQLTRAFGVKFSRSAVIRMALHALEDDPRVSQQAAEEAQLC